MRRKKGEPDLSAWYKPTKEGAKARKILMDNITPDVEEVKNGLKTVAEAEAGAVGEEVDKHEKKRRKGQ